MLFGIVVPRMRRARQKNLGITLVAFSDPSVTVPPRPHQPERATEPVKSEAATPPAHSRSPYAPPAQQATGTLGTEWPGTAAPVGPEPPTPRLRLETSDRMSDTPVDPRPALKMHRPIDGTLQFLPGRLEIIEGRELGQEIRFVRQPGPGPTEVTFGRQDGVPYRHIQLHEPTVSRLHARMTLEDRDWRLTNLSRTNPVSVNGTPMGAENGSLILTEGDRIEMGEVVFRFHAK